MLSILLAAADAGSSVALKDLTPFVTAISGALTGFLAAKRSAKADKVQYEQNELTSLMQGYTNQISAYSGIVESLQQEVLRLRTQFDLDRTAWDLEKKEMFKVRSDQQQQISNLELEIERLKSPKDQ